MPQNLRYAPCYSIQRDLFNLKVDSLHHMRIDGLPDGTQDCTTAIYWYKTIIIRTVFIQQNKADFCREWRPDRLNHELRATDSYLPGHDEIEHTYTA